MGTTFWIRSILLVIFTGISIEITNANIQIDPHGYILYCPCMGRFGNQADHFLGSLGFAHAINRTLVLPPWVEYRQRELQSHQVPFATYFNVNTIAKFHRVMTMESFMETTAPVVWPPERRISFCYMHRDSLKKENNDENIAKSCNAKEGNPFGPFWNTFQIDFVESEFFGPLSYDIDNDLARQWTHRYPSDQWPVLAFTGAPASFPVNEKYRSLHKYLKWSEMVASQAQEFIENTIGNVPFLGIHLRNGIDWIRACDHIKNSPNLFSAAQCLGYRNEHGNATLDMCLPTRDIVLKQIRSQIKHFKQKHVSRSDEEIRAIFVASDSNHMIDDFNKLFRRSNISAHKLPISSPHIDLAILGRANHFIGNCVSSFSAFVARERSTKGLPTSFWAFAKESKNMIEKKKSNIEPHVEL